MPSESEGEMGHNPPIRGKASKTVTWNVYLGWECVRVFAATRPEGPAPGDVRYGYRSFIFKRDTHRRRKLFLPWW